MISFSHDRVTRLKEKMCYYKGDMPYRRLNSKIRMSCNPSNNCDLQIVL